MSTRDERLKERVVNTVVNPSSDADTQLVAVAGGDKITLRVEGVGDKGHGTYLTAGEAIAIAEALLAAAGYRW